MPIETSQISQLLPLRGLPEPVLSYIKQLAWIEQANPGDDLYAPDATRDSAYLLKGEVSLQHVNGSIRTIKAGSIEANIPLIAPRPSEAIHALCSGDVELLCLPRDLVASIYSSWWESNQAVKTGIELKEDNLEDQIYMSFYQKIKSGDYELPSMPDIAVKISKAVENSNSSSADLARIITADPPLAARLIRTANSPAFGGEKSITDCRDAVTRLGYGNTRNLVTSFVLKNLFKTDAILIQKRMKQLWNHSRRVAAISHVLASMSPGLISDRAILTGLIHDIGAIPILVAAAEYPELIDNPMKLDNLVNSLKGEVGALILSNWGFPQSDIEATLHCDEWFRFNDQPADYTDLVIVAQLFSYVGTQEMRNLPAPDLSPAFHKIAGGKLNPLTSIAIINEAEKEINAIEELLEGN
ncbi:MAG: HDOD domain-containing protein [Sedimenticola sp.]|uniref:HDOD domain-containing protein n=1 Tax=Sedimenticola thiotaurini TaxID=1543721 RepID=A0A558D152_9GAMM|nr:HDOD domain-containing protein [Sedimenticola sp.]MCW8945853.1 HDOD domain-containing protein [Sedimenticola sp.]MCW8950716.1 HDOD domain-containing protein [Sedimenticola sp.]MCW8975057.1 HDOD domain-containing protein [Sedimenticola sp.]TVT54747.1 MAG: HDOD domain-containing protein [Sedimenticola thiotaurini]